VFVGAALLVALGSGGCVKPFQRANSGTIVGSQQRWVLALAAVRVIEVQTNDGRTVRLGELAGPLYLVCFVEAPAGLPCFIDPKLRQIASTLSVDEVFVVQITLPTVAHPLTGPDVEACPAPSKNLIRLFDRQKIGSRAYSQPQAGDMALMDDSGHIISNGKLDDPGYILFRTQQEIQAQDKADWSGSGGMGG